MNRTERLIWLSNCRLCERGRVTGGCPCCNVECVVIALQLNLSGVLLNKQEEGGMLSTKTPSF